MKKTVIVFLFMTFSWLSFGQDKIPIEEQDYTNEKVEMADDFRADGKIYILTGVILLILGGMFFYLYKIDRKVTTLEKQLKNKNL